MELLWLIKGEVPQDLPIQTSLLSFLKPSWHTHVNPPSVFWHSVWAVSEQSFRLSEAHSTTSSSQELPSQPALQWHVPSTWSHDCTCCPWQSQVCVQPSPKVPSGQAGNRMKNGDGLTLQSKTETVSLLERRLLTDKQKTHRQIQTQMVYLTWATSPISNRLLTDIHKETQCTK